MVLCVFVFDMVVYRIETRAKQVRIALRLIGFYFLE